MEQKEKTVPRSILWPFILLIVLFFAWGVPNNLTDTMLAAFKRIMSLSDSKTAWIQVVCYLLGYGCFALPGALLIKRYSYKTGVIVGLAMYSLGTFLFMPASNVAVTNNSLGYLMFLFAILVLFAGLSVLETSANSYVLAIGPESTATRRLNLAQSFNPFGAISGVVISQVFILSQLNTKTAAERASMSEAELAAIQSGELNAITTTYVILGIVMLVILGLFLISKFPKIQEDSGPMNIKESVGRLVKNKKYVMGVAAEFFYVGAQIAAWSYTIRYAMQALGFDSIIASLGPGATSGQIVSALRGVEPVAGVFYSVCDAIGLDALLPRTAEQAGATYYIMSLILFVVMRFVCTWLLKWIKPRKLLSVMSLLAVLCCLGTVFGKGATGVYCLMCISGCMSLMFPTIYGLGVNGLGKDTKIGGSGMVMAIAGASVLTQIAGVLSDKSGNIAVSYLVSTAGFLFILYYAAVFCRKHNV